MSHLMQASNQWANRPADERFLSLPAMQAHFDAQRAASREVVVSNRRLLLEPTPDNKGLVVVDAAATAPGDTSIGYAPTHFAFGQLAALAEAPAGYLRTLPSPIAADCVNYGLQYKRNIEEIGTLLYRNGGEPVLRAATGPRYGRIWNTEIIASLIRHFGDGINGHFRVPGEFGQRVEVTKANTTLYGGDRDMFVFLADEERRIAVPNRRDGAAGEMARGFFCWNSEVGSATFGVATFLFDYVCCNRIVWGAEHYKEITIRHTVSAPDRYVEQLVPALESYAAGSTADVTQAIAHAQAARIDNIDDFLAKRFSKRQTVAIKAAHEADEGRPIETLWDATTGVTAFARSVGYQDQRVALEREAGRIFDLASA